MPSTTEARPAVRRITAKDRETILRLASRVRNTPSEQEIADAVGCSRVTVKRVIKQAQIVAEGGTVRTNADPISDAEKAKFIRLYGRKKDPLAIRVIAEQEGRSYGAVNRVLREAAARGEVTLRGQGGTRAKAKPAKKATAAKTAK